MQFGKGNFFNERRISSVTSVAKMFFLAVHLPVWLVGGLVVTTRIVNCVSFLCLRDPSFSLAKTKLRPLNDISYLFKFFILSTNMLDYNIVLHSSSFDHSQSLSVIKHVFHVTKHLELEVDENYILYILAIIDPVTLFITIAIFEIGYFCINSHWIMGNGFYGIKHR